MFSFSRCVGRRQKSSPQRPELAEALVPGSDHSVSIKEFSESEPKKLDNSECTMGTPMSLKNARKKSYCSSIISRSSASFNQLCSGFTLVEPVQVVNDGQLSSDPGWTTPQTKSKLSSGALNLQIKCTDFSLDRSLIIHEEGEEPLTARPHSYSDDPFAPPTPRVATCTPGSCRDSDADSDTIGLRVSSLIAHARPIDLKEEPIPIPPVQPQLPTIARISKLSFGDWVLESPKESPALLTRSRLPSTTRRSTASTVPTCRTLTGTHAMNSPRTPHAMYSSRSIASNQVPFPEYP